MTPAELPVSAFFRESCVLEIYTTWLTDLDSKMLTVQIVSVPFSGLEKETARRKQIAYERRVKLLKICLLRGNFRSICTFAGALQIDAANHGTEL